MSDKAAEWHHTPGQLAPHRGNPHGKRRHVECEGMIEDGTFKTPRWRADYPVLSFSLPPHHPRLTQTLFRMGDALADALDRVLTLSGDDPNRGENPTLGSQYLC